MDYQEAVNYIGSIPKFTKKHDLAHTRELLARLGSPGENCHIVHVAGTNGKGSVCTYISNILTAHGKRTGLFTSPHLVKINERFRINGEMVTDAVFLRAFADVYKAAREMEAATLGHPSYFEFLFAMGMLIFTAARVEYLVLETGLGGRLDATNVVARPDVTVITAIGLDHMQILGDTIAKIAGEKAGIIKPGVPLIYDAQDPEARAVIAAAAARAQAPARAVTAAELMIRPGPGKGIDFSLRTQYDEKEIFHLAQPGRYQVMNAALALLAVAVVLGPKELGLTRVKAALAATRVQGRMEEILPGITIDGGHNPSAVAAFCDTLAERNTSRDVCVFTAVADKDYPRMIRYLCRHLDVEEYIVTQLHDERKVESAVLERLFKESTDKKVIDTKNVGEAMQLSARLAENGRHVYCLGSLYLVGEIEAWARKKGIADVRF